MDTRSPLFLLVLVAGILAALGLFALIVVGGVRLIALLSGYYDLAERYPSDRQPPLNTGMFQGQLGFLHSASLQIGSNGEGVYLCDPLAGKRAAFIPWSELGSGRRLAKVVAFTVGTPGVTLVVAQSIVANRP